MSGRHVTSRVITRLLSIALLAVGFVCAAAEFSVAHAAGPGAPFSFGDSLLNEAPVHSLVTADLDGDGVPELIGSEPDADRIMVWEANGAGGLRVKRTISCTRPGELIAADFNGDGVIDLATRTLRESNAPYLDPAATSVLLLRGLGGGAFAGPHAIAFSRMLNRLACGDFNGDGHPDLFTIADYDSMVMLAGTSAGFAPPAMFYLPDGIGSFALGDLDGDGRDELIVLSYLGTKVFFGNSSDTLGMPAELPSIPYDTSYPLVQDFDGDGAADLVVPKYPGGFDVYWNSGHELPATPEFVPGCSAFTARVVAADLDGDGRNDLLCTPDHGATERILVEWNLGSRAWEQTCLYVSDYPYPEGPIALAAFDLDLDGLTDIVRANLSDGRITGTLRGYRHFSERRFAAFEEFAYPEEIARTWVIAMPDGTPAVLVQGITSTQVMIARPDGSLSAPVPYESAAGAKSLDWNGDGCRDLAIPSSGGLDLYLCGGGHEQIPTLPSTPYECHGDFDGDGFADLILRPAGGDLQFARGDGGSSFLPVTPVEFYPPLPQGRAPVAAGDFNGDGLCDLAVGVQSFGQSVDSLIVYLSAGAGRFARHFAAGLPPVFVDYGNPWLYHLHAVDLELDGKLDIVVGSAYSDAPGLGWVAHGLGNGTFAMQPEIYEFPKEAPATAVIDVTNDGLPDLLSLAPNNWGGFGSLSFRANLGGGRFEQSGLQKYVGIYPLSIGVGDLNRDGRTDLVIAGNGFPANDYSRKGTVRILLNTSHDVATPVALAPQRAIFQQGHAHIEWLSQNRAEFSGTVMRSEHSGSWQEVGAAWSDGAGLVVFNDASVQPGTRYAYRFDYVVNGVTQQSATIDLIVPAAGLSLAIASGNPTHGRLRFACTVPGAEPATLDLFDIAGRRVESQPLKRAPSGDVTAVLNAAAVLDAGVYWARLRQGPCVAGTRVVLLP